MNFHGSLSLDIKTVLGIMVGISYVLYFVLQVIMVRDGFRHKSYGMPLLSIASLMAVCFIAVIGPWIPGMAHLFYDKGDIPLIITWVVSWLLMVVIFVQYLIYGRNHPHADQHVANYFFLIAFGTVIGATVFVYSFIVFYQDFYVNQIYPLAMLFLAIGYFGSLVTRPQLYGLSTVVAWMWFVATALLYLGTSLGEMTKTYPNHEHTGFFYIYYLYALTVLLLGLYAIGLTRRRNELNPDHAESVRSRGVHCMRSG